MDRLTGKDAQLMMEALANVYEKKGDCVDKDKKTKHNCAKKVCSEQWGEGTCVPEHHTLLEDGTVTHYDVVFEHGLERMVPVEELEVLVTEMHEHAAMEGEELQENQANRAKQQRLRQQQNAGRAEQQFGALKPKPASYSFADRRRFRRSSSAAAQANTNRVGQNIKVGSPTGPAQNDQLKKPTGTAPAAPTSMANKAPSGAERRLPTMAELRAAQAARAAAKAAGKNRADQESAAVKAGVGEGQRKPPTAPPPVSAGKPAMSGPGGYSVPSGAKPKANLGAKNPMSTPMTVSTPSGSNTYQPGQRMSTADTATMRAAQQQFRPKPTGSAAGAAAGAAKPATGAAAAPVVKKKPAMGARNRMRMEELDVFDTIKEYLIGEGATEEEALKQMLILTDEQRTEILEGLFDFLPKSKTVVPGIYGKNTVLAKKDGKEGVMNKQTGEFKKQKGGWDKIDAERYSKEYFKQNRGALGSGVNHANRRVTPNRVK